MKPSEIGRSFGSDRNYRTYFIIIGPENCSKLPIVASIPDRMNKGPKYFLNDAMIFFGFDYSQL